MSKQKHSSQGALIVIVAICVAVITVIALMGCQDKDPAPKPENTAMATTDVHTDTQRPAATDTNTVQPTTQEKVTDTPPATTDKPSVTESSKPSVTNTDTGTTNTNKEPYVSKNDTASFSKDQWYMILVNPDHAIPDGLIDSLDFATIRSNEKNWKIDARIADDMKAMIAAAKADGVELIFCSVFRSIERQTTNFNNYVEARMKEHHDWTREQAIEYTSHIIAVPGTSEHHTGLAADIVTPSYQRLNEGFAKTAAFKWLYAHCAEYGFILRYAKDKQDITKIIYEPWHYRYVGKEAATIIMNEGICFEEFVEKYGT